MRPFAKGVAGLVVFLCLIAGVSYADDLTIGNYTLVSSARVSRVEYEYTYKADITNTGVSVENVTAQVTSNSSNTVVVEGILEFGDVGEGGMVTSSDTFVIKQNRLYPLDWDDLVWDVQYDTSGPIDNCPGDPDKTEPGICGCGIADTDSDSDGTADCIDECPDDANKIAAGVCGCNEADVDSDGDGTFDCNDGCPKDVGKTEPGICGCGEEDADSDNDSVIDCNDICLNTPDGETVDLDGCSASQKDTDNDGVDDGSDNCLSIYNPEQADSDNNGVGDACEEEPVTGKIVYTSDQSGNYDIWLMDEDGSNRTQLTFSESNEHQPRWSPDGTQIAYLQDEGNNSSTLYIMNSDGTNPTAIITGAYGSSGILWSPDGQYIYYAKWLSTCVTSVYKNTIDGNNETLFLNSSVIPGKNEFRLGDSSADKIVFYAQEGCWSPTYEIYTCNYDGTNIEQYTYDSNQDIGPIWNYDETALFWKKYTGYNTPTSIHSINKDKTDPLTILTSSSHIMPLTPLPGNRILYSNYESGYNQFWIMNEDGSIAVALTNDNFNYGTADYFFKETGKIVYTSDKNGNYDIFVMDEDGTNITQLTDGSNNENQPCWSPDGNKIVYLSSQGGMSSDVVIMDADGSNKTHIASNAYGSSRTAWSPDGQYIFYARWHSTCETYIYRNNISGTDEILFLSPSDISGKHEFRLGDTSADKIVFIAQDGCSSPTYQIYTCDYDGNNIEQLTNDGNALFNPVWNYNEDVIFFMKYSGIYLPTRMCSIDGNTSTILFTSSGYVSPLTSMPDNRIIYSDSSSPTGKQQLWVMDEDGSNRLQLTNSDFNSGGADYFGN